MKRQKPRHSLFRSAFAALLAIAIMLSCGLFAIASEESQTDVMQETMPPVITVPIPEPTPEEPKSAAQELYPTDVQSIFEGATRQIVKTYTLSPGQRPSDIPRDSFDRDGWKYSLTDITENRTSINETREHTETVEINTDSNDLNEIVLLLVPAIEYQSEDGFSGFLVLDLATVQCEPEGYRTSRRTVTATREYPHLSCADTSLIPKTITDNGRELMLECVEWEPQSLTTVDYESIPDSYRAIAVYTAEATWRAVTGYITTAEYTGEISRTVAGDSVYTAYFSGEEIIPVPKQQTEPSPATAAPLTPPAQPEPSPKTTPMPKSEPAAAAHNGIAQFIPLFIALAALLALGGAAAYIFLHRNVRICRDNSGEVIAKDRVSAKKTTIDLTPLDVEPGERCFMLVIERASAKKLNGKIISVVHGPSRLQHPVAFEGNTYNIEADFSKGTTKAIFDDRKGFAEK